MERTIFEARFPMRGNPSWMGLALFAMIGPVGCVGGAPALPEVIVVSDETVAGSVTEAAAGTTLGEDLSTGASGSTAECGNGMVEVGEQCDGTELQGATCESLSQAAGALSCSVECRFDVSGCVPSGMVLVPGGEFEMGSTDAFDAQPVRSVYVDSFWIDETEVTVAEYEQCVSAGACVVPDVNSSYCNWGDIGRVHHPINCVHWYHAANFCRWVDFGEARLPTEAEWEKAARGDDARSYPWGDEPPPSCEYLVMGSDTVTGCGEDTTWEVGSKPLGVSPYGVFDMSGNVGEWVADWYAPIYDFSDNNNPLGVGFGSQKIIRGGSFQHTNAELFSTFWRSSLFPEYPQNYTGFRCVRTPP